MNFFGAQVTRLCYTAKLPNNIALCGEDPPTSTMGDVLVADDGAYIAVPTTGKRI